MTLIYAHRGFSATYPENTMLAFEKAAEKGADGIELDVQLTKDDEVIVMHDITVDRTTNGKGFVKNFTLMQLKQLTANYKFTLNKTLKIPTLIEVFEWLVTNNLFCIIELKNAQINYEQLEEIVIALIYKYNLQDRVIISSFNHYSLVKSYQIAPQIETAPLYRDGLYMPWDYAKWLKARAIHPSYIVATNEIVEQSIKNGIKVRPYTVNKIEEMRRFFKINCSAIITNEITKAIKVKKDRN